MQISEDINFDNEFEDLSISKKSRQIKQSQIKSYERNKLRRYNQIKSGSNGYDIIDKSYNYNHDDPKISSANTLSHELAKSSIIYLLKKRKIKCVCECRFNNGSRADVYIPSRFIVIEIMESESVTKLDNKVQKYPTEIQFIYAYKSKEIMDSSFVKELNEVLK